MKGSTMLKALSVTALSALSLASVSTIAIADTLDDVKARGSIIVGVESGGTGAILSQQPDGKIIGLDADLNAYVAQKLGVKLELVPTAWPGIIPALLSSRFDMIMSGMTATKARAEKVNFSIPYGDASLVAAALAGNDKIKTPDDFAGQSIGVLLGTNTQEFAKKFSAGLAAAGKPALVIKTYDDIPSMLVDLGNGNIGALMLPSPILGGYLVKRPGEFKLIKGLGDKSYFGVAIRKEDVRLLDAVNKALEDAKTDGTLEKLQVKWLGQPIGTLPSNWDTGM
jgi:polar amino acid transport system substrate-binding protein